MDDFFKEIFLILYRTNDPEIISKKIQERFNDLEEKKQKGLIEEARIIAKEIGDLCLSCHDLYLNDLKNIISFIPYEKDPEIRL